MNPVNDIVKELEELGSPLANMPKVMPFSVPDAYFASFAEMIPSVVADKDPVLDMPKGMPFALPENYFEVFAATIPDKVEAPSFATKPVAGFEVPEGYFNDFAANILNIAKAADSPANDVAPIVERTEKKETKVINFGLKYTAVRWAAAAALILGVGFGSYKMFNNTGSIETSTAQQLAMLDKSLINSYVQHHIEEFDTEMLTEHNSILNLSPEKNIKSMEKQDIKQYLDDEDLGGQEVDL